MSTFNTIRDRMVTSAIPPPDRMLTDEERHRLDQEIDDLLDRIREQPDAKAADRLLEQLGEMEDVVVTLYCKFKVAVSEKQRQLFRNYDRWDLPEVRSRVFTAIKNKTFLQVPPSP